MDDEPDIQVESACADQLDDPFERWSHATAFDPGDGRLGGPSAFGQLGLRQAGAPASFANELGALHGARQYSAYAMSRRYRPEAFDRALEAVALRELVGALRIRDRDAIP